MLGDFSERAGAPCARRVGLAECGSQAHRGRASCPGSARLSDYMLTSTSARSPEGDRNKVIDRPSGADVKTQNVKRVVMTTLPFVSRKRGRSS